MTYSISSAYLSSLAYNVSTLQIGNSFVDPLGATWVLKDFKDDPQTDYQGAIFVNVATNQVVLANRGSESTVDLGNDLAIGRAALPSQYASAESAYTMASNIAISLGVPASSVVITGHSLGGSLAQMLGAAHHDNPTTTFNAYGVGNVLPVLGIPTGSFNNITNNVMRFDPISGLPGSNMIGQTTQYSSAIDTFFDRPEMQTLIALSGNALSI